MSLAPNFQWFQENQARFHGSLHFQEPLSRHTYYRIGGHATLLAVPASQEDLEWLHEGILHTQIPFFIVGAGSNLLVSDQGFSGLIIKTHRLNLNISKLNEKIQLGASVAVSTLLRKAAHEGWTGFECLTGIPGLIGGVTFMNGGTHLGEAQDQLSSISVYLLQQGKWKKFTKNEFKYAYRKNEFLPKDAVIYETEWEFESLLPTEVKKKIDEILSRRKSTQPLDFPSCGSVFKNPRTPTFMHAWQVIDHLQLRGHQIGNAQFSEKHSNFILNLGNASAMDVYGLIQLAKKRAQEELGLILEEEVKFLGGFSKI